MDTAIPVLIAVILLLLPFFYIAKAIFFFRENRQLNYRSVYIRALIYGLFGFIIIGLYISIPSMVYKMETGKQVAHTGAYAGINSRDTIVLDGFQMKHRYGDNPMDNYTSTYFLTSRINNNNDLWTKVKDAVAYSMLGKKIGIESEMLTLNYPIRTSVYNTQPGKKNKKNQPRPANDNANIINKYYLSLNSDTLTLVPFNNYSQAYKYLRFANYY